LPFQLENFEHVIKMLDGTEERLYVAPIEQWDKFKEAVQKVMAKDNIRSLGTALAKMSEQIIELYKPQRTPMSLTEEPCLSCKPETKQHCLTPGDPGPNCEREA
jgi:tRNA(Ile2) C34 agmatinyltransferase TiaS